MKHLILPILIILSSCSSLSQRQHTSLTTEDLSETRVILDSIISITKEQSVYTENVNWDVLENQTINLFIDNDSISSLKTSIEYMLTELGDFHGFAIINGERHQGNIERTRDVSYDYKGQSYINGMSRIYQNALKNDTIFSAIINDSIGYIQIPMIINNSGNDSINISYTSRIRNKLCELEKENPKGYLIDLRGNLGGNVHPMMSGLGELFPDMELGGDTKDGKSFYSVWKLKDGIFYMDDYSVPGTIKCQCNVSLKNRRVAVIIGRYTSSSGEAVASSLKGQKNIKLFGEQTSGASTTNSFMTITENVYFNPAIAYYMSNNRTVHKDGVLPDIEVIEEYNYENPTNGTVIKKSIDWVNTGYNTVYKK